MHLSKSFFLAAALVGSGFAATQVDPPPVAAPTTVNVPSPISELAAGYAAATQHMSLKSLAIYYKSDDKVIALKGIRSVQSMGGVLLVTFSGGDLMAINAEKVILVTDGTRTP